METKEVIGRNPVLEYLSALREPAGAELFVSKTAHGKIIDVIVSTARSKGVRVISCEKEVLARVDSSSRHQGVMLRIQRGSVALRDDEFLEEVCAKKGVLVALDQLTDPHNIGSIIRSTEALGGDGVILTKSHSSDITPTVIKSSAGATAHCKTIAVSNMAQFLEKARSLGFWIIGASADGDTALERLRELKPAVIIIGSEGGGMRRLTGEKCDYMARIPLRGNITSLNASVAAGIIIHEILKD